MANNPVPDRRNMQTLQQEAIRRAREMQARAQIPPTYAPPRPQANAPHPRTEQMPVHSDPQPPRQRPRPAPSAPGQAEDISPTGALDVLFQDSERSLILMLLLILMEEKADTSLIFALMYLLV